MSDLTLKIDGFNYTGWKQVGIVRSLEQIADTFELTLTDKWGRNDLAARDIKTSMPCEILINNQLVITGYIDEAFPSYDAKKHAVTVRGRSKAGDLVDCSLPGRSFKGENLLGGAQSHCKPFGIDVRSDVDVSKPFYDMAREDGQSIYEYLEQWARIRAVRIISEPNGNLLITRAGSERIDTALELGVNIRAAGGQFSTRDRFSEYVVQGQRGGSNFSFGGEVAHMRGSAKDSRWESDGRYRPIVIDAESPVDIDDCQRRAQWQRNTAYGRSQAVIYTVRGWTHKSGLWQPNYLVPVIDRWMGIKQDQLIATTQYLLDENGERTEIKVMPKEAFDLVELPEPVSNEVSW